MMWRRFSVTIALRIPVSTSTTTAQPVVESFDQYAAHQPDACAGLRRGCCVAGLPAELGPQPCSLCRRPALVHHRRLSGHHSHCADYVEGIAYALGAKAWNQRVGADRQRAWGWAVVPVALLYMLVATSVAIVLLILVEFAFEQLTLIRMQAALAMGLGTALLVMWIAGNAMRLTSSGLLKMVLVILGMGVYLTAITIDDPQWWRVSFSYLGKLESNVNFIFNGTLIFAGILLLVWRSYFLSDFRVAVRHGAAAERWAVWLGWALVWLAVGIMIVGIFKSRLNPFSSIMHNVAAYSLAGVFAVLMATTRWTVPRYPREFHLLSVTLVVVLLATLASRALHVVNTVGLEVVSFMLGLLWLVQFARTTESVAAHLERDAFPQ